MEKRAYTALIRNIPDFPIPGIQFKDITTLLRNGSAFQAVIDDFVAAFRDQQIDIVAGIESRGFIFAAPLALALGAGMAPIRKPGKLPYKTVQVEYSLEYGTNILQMHDDAFDSGARVLVIDDLLATGGTTAAAVKLIEQIGGVVVAAAFVIELTFLDGRSRLGGTPIFSLVQY